jgi:hypothetical protein
MRYYPEIVLHYDYQANYKRKYFRIKKGFSKCTGPCFFYNEDLGIRYQVQSIRIYKQSDFLYLN